MLQQAPTVRANVSCRANSARPAADRTAVPPGSPGARRLAAAEPLSMGQLGTRRRTHRGPGGLRRLLEPQSSTRPVPSQAELIFAFNEWALTTEAPNAQEFVGRLLTAIVDDDVDDR